MTTSDSLNQKRAAIYARVSTDEQRNNYSIPTQIEGCIEYIERLGYRLCGDRYVDPVTGYDTTADAPEAVPAFVDDYTSRELVRPALDAALNYLETTGFDVLVVYVLDRMARDPYIRRTLEIEFGAKGAQIQYVLGNYEDGFQGEIRKGLDSVFAMWESAVRLERSLRGKRGKAERGSFVGGRPPYGYALSEVDPSGLSPDDQTASIVQRVFHLYVEEGISMSAIARMLTAEKVPSPHGKTTWHASTVQRILTNTTYSGTSYYNKTTRKGTKTTVKDASEWIAFATPPIISPDTFQKAQKCIEHARAHIRRHPKRYYLLQGMVFCEGCGKVYVGRANRAGIHSRKTEVRLYGHRIKHGHCRNHSIHGPRLEDAVWDLVVNALLDPENLQQGYAGVLEQQQSKRSQYLKDLEAIAARIANLQQRKQNLTLAYTDPAVGMSKSEYLAVRAQLDEELTVAAGRKEELEDRLAILPTPIDLEELERFTVTVREYLLGDTDPPLDEKRRILELLQIRVLISTDGTASVEGWLPVGRIEGYSYTSS